MSLNSVVSHKDLELLVDHFHSHLDLSNLTDIHGNNLLHVASYAGRNSAVKILLNKRLPINKRNNMELLSIDLAFMVGHDSIVDISRYFFNFAKCFPLKELHLLVFVLFI